MTGMFQSSRIASGRPRLQACSAFSPSSASMIWKSNSSRMRLAIFRMTVESSTMLDERPDLLRIVPGLNVNREKAD